jgi:serine/threonine protein kinase
MNVCPPGSLIGGQFRVASQPLEGGQGIVYLCTDTQTGRPLALKTWRSEYLSDRAARDRHYWTEALPILEAVEDPSAARLRSMLRQLGPR